MYISEAYPTGDANVSKSVDLPFGFDDTVSQEVTVRGSEKFDPADISLLWCWPGRAKGS